MVLVKSFLEAQERKWMVLTPIFYVGLWFVCGYEIRYALFAEVTQATVTDREAQVEDERNGKTFVTMTYSFKDVSTGKMRTETEVGIVETRDDPEIAIQYLPGVAGESRRYSAWNEYFMILFLGFNLLAGGLLWWGYSMFKSDTWASNPGQRV